MMAGAVVGDAVAIGAVVGIGLAASDGFEPCDILHPTVRPTAITQKTVLAADIDRMESALGRLFIGISANNSADSLMSVRRRRNRITLPQIFQRLGQGL